MYSKLKISATIEIITGLHIGGSDTYSAIGAVSSPVIRDSLTGCPIIPGSSLKGKMRVLLSRSIKKELKPDDDPDPVKRLFGTSNNSGQAAIVVQTAIVIQTAMIVKVVLIIQIIKQINFIHVYSFGTHSLSILKSSKKSG